MAKIKNYAMLIDGAWVQASNGASFDSINPTTGRVWARIPEATEDDVDRAVRAAHQALNNGLWGKMTATERGQCLHRLANLLQSDSERLGQVETVDTGKMLKETREQARYIAEYIRFYGGCADKVRGETFPIDKPDLFVFTNREPIGVIAAVVPWNAQLFLSAVKLGPALAAGNTIVLKASEHASAALLEFGRLISKAGIPDGVVNIISGHGNPCGQCLTTHPLVARISFTGGHQAASKVVQNSSKNFAEVSLELGGKSPFIVFDDADIESAVNGCVGGIFGASGQSCVAGSRLYLQESIADEFLHRIKTVASKIRIGNPLAEETEMGPLCTLEQLTNIESEVMSAQNEGCTILTGGKRLDGLAGYFFEPTIITCPRHSIGIVDRELFGPVLAVIRFKTEEEVVKLANDTKYGLAAGIFTRDGARSLRISKAIKAGIVYVNTYRVISPIAEFGGSKHSGYGRESGFQAIYDYTRPKTIWINTSDKPLASQFVMR